MLSNARKSHIHPVTELEGHRRRVIISQELCTTQRSNQMSIGSDTFSMKCMYGKREREIEREQYVNNTLSLIRRKQSS